MPQHSLCSVVEGCHAAIAARQLLTFLHDRKSAGNTKIQERASLPPDRAMASHAAAGIISIVSSHLHSLCLTANQQSLPLHSCRSSAECMARTWRKLLLHVLQSTAAHWVACAVCSMMTCITLSVVRQYQSRTRVIPCHLDGGILLHRSDLRGRSVEAARLPSLQERGTAY